MNPDQPSKLTFETAAQHASTEVPVFPPACRAAEVRQQLAGRQYESASLVIVCEQRKFLGVVRIEDLLAAAADTPLNDLMDREAPVVAPGVDQEVAAWHAVRNGESALTVVDREGHFAGVIQIGRAHV